MANASPRRREDRRLNGNARGKRDWKPNALKQLRENYKRPIVEK
jgi:hypothetical protein